MVHIDLPSDREVDQSIPDDERSAHAGHVVSRFGIPLVLLVIGIVVLILGWTVFGIVAVLAAAIAAVADRLIRLGIVSQRDRDREDEERQRMRQRGRWSR